MEKIKHSSAQSHCYQRDISLLETADGDGKHRWISMAPGGWGWWNFMDSAGIGVTLKGIDVAESSDRLCAMLDLRTFCGGAPL